MKMSKNYEHCNVGMGIHSMRGVSLENIIKLADYRQGNTPFHIHIAEQLKEIKDCISFTGMRPTEWFIKNIELNKNFHLVHATHLSETESSQLAISGANVVICPTTEGNLGDGLFRLDSFLKQKGKWCIGSDSHVGLNPFEELRLLDYGQRLTSHSRNTFGNSSSGDNGAIAIKSALVNGRRAMGMENETYFKVGTPLDAVVISDGHPLIGMTGMKHLTNTIVYASDASMIQGTIAGGSWKIRKGESQDTQIEQNFIKTMKDLSNRL
jgi:formimidoylglutamate deiminase